MRVGFGYDIHPFKKGKGFHLGGVPIIYKKKLKGHSDADVVIHAVMDSLLGAMGKGDIGQLFPSNNPFYKDISSLLLLKEVKKMLNEDSYKVNNIDITIVAEEPKLNDYFFAMRSSIASVLNINDNIVNIKATTSEGLGPIGRAKGIEAYAVCLILKEEK